MANLSTTKDVYFREGTYSEFRQVVHTSIVQELTAHVKPAIEQPIVVFLGGGSASGKTSISKQLLQTFKDDGETVIYLDSDVIKTLIPEHKAFLEQNPATAASRLHEESSDIGTMLFEHGLKHNMNIVVDGTLKDAANALKKIMQAREHGYAVHVIVADVPLEEALRRAEKRFEIEQRCVPEHIIRESHQQVPMTIKRIENLVDSVYLYDTSARQPVQFYQKENGEVQFVNAARLEAFYAKAGARAEAEQWKLLNQPRPLRDVLKLGKGVPVGSNVTAELLNSLVERFAFEAINGAETLKFQLQGETKLQQIRCEQAPYLSKQTRNEWLDQASHRSSTMIEQRPSIEL